MRYLLLNPAWRFDGSIYFGCPEPHLPLEFGYAAALLEAAGHTVLLLDAHRHGLDEAAVYAAVAEFRPDITVLTTAPTYLFWRCPPPELRLPRRYAALLRPVAGRLVLVGPHGSTTPRPALRKVGADAAVLGECEQVLPRLADTRWERIDGLARVEGDAVVVQGGPQGADLTALPPLRWPAELLHAHHHHRFDAAPRGLGAEVETSRGCPFTCTFCAKQTHRDRYRRRPLPVVLAELDRLIAQGVGYVYFIDEIFLPDAALLEALAARDIRFGVQTRIDLWRPDQLDLLGAAGCVSIEAGVESVSELGRQLLDKRCRLDSEALRARLVHARSSVPFVQASLIDTGYDEREAIEAWRRELIAAGVWANEPVPLFPYPGSPGYTRMWGAPDDRAWERALEHYLGVFSTFSDVQGGGAGGGFRGLGELEE